MPRQLTPTESLTVESRRKTTKPSVYEPKAATATPISASFEAWLILAQQQSKSTMLTWIEELQKVEADKDYEDLLKETLWQEAGSLDQQQQDLAAKLTTFTSWRQNPDVAGWEDVAEIGWLMQELQQGFSPQGEKDLLSYLQQHAKGVNVRFVTTKKGAAARKLRLNAWASALNAYGGT